MEIRTSKVSLLVISFLRLQEEEEEQQEDEIEIEVVDDEESEQEKQRRMFEFDQNWEKYKNGWYMRYRPVQYISP